MVLKYKEFVENYEREKQKLIEKHEVSQCYTVHFKIAHNFSSLKALRKFTLPVGLLLYESLVK